MALPVLGNVRKAGRDRVVGRADIGRGSGDPQVAGLPRLQPEKGFHDFRASGSNQPVESEDLSLLEIEGHAIKLGQVAKAVNLKNGVSNFCRGLGVDVVQGPANHGSDELCFGCLRDGSRSGRARRPEARCTDRRCGILRPICGR